MKYIGTTISMLVLAGSLAGTAMAGNDGILLKEQASNDYCHMQFPAIRQHTLGSANPELKKSDTGDVIDFYGSCDESPTGPDQVALQKLQERDRMDRYSD
jgi:hypothetical protein